VLAKPVGMNCEDCPWPCAWLFWLCCGGVDDWGGASGRGSMRCIVRVCLLSPRRVLLDGRVFCLSCVSGGLSYCVNVKRSAVMEMLLGGRASQVFSAGAVVVTAAFAFACKRHGGASSQLGSGGLLH